MVNLVIKSALITSLLSIPIALTQCSTGDIVLRSYADLENYLNTHKKIHDSADDAADYSTEPTDYQPMLDYFWSRHNFGIQNLINGSIASALQTGHSNTNFTLKLRVTNNSVHSFLTIPGVRTEKLDLSWSSSSNTGPISFHFTIAYNSISDSSEGVLLNVADVTKISLTNVDYSYGTVTYTNDMANHFTSFHIWLKEYPSLSLPISIGV